MGHDLTAFQQPMTTRGDVIAEDSTPKPVRLGLGTADQVFAVNHAATDPVWQTVSTLLDNLFSNSQGAVLYRGSSAWVALAPGTSGQFLKTLGAAANPLWADVTTAAGLPTRFIRGLTFSQLTSSGTVITVLTGQARDSADAANINFTAASDTVDITTNGINGLDRKQIADAVSKSVTTSNVAATVTGTSTTFTTDFGTRVMTGTFATVTASTTVTGTSTKFLSEVAVGDLIGNATGGWSRVTVIASDTSLTVSTAITLANGAAGSIMENVTFQAAAQTAQRVNFITDDTHLTLAANSSATASNTTAFAGARVTNAAMWIYVWIGAGGSGTKPFASTQRTTAFGISGYNTSVRRTGAIPLNSSGTMLACQQIGDDTYRLTQYEEAQGNMVVISAGAATAWTASTSSNAFAPPTSKAIRVLVKSAPSAGSVEVYLRPRGTGNSSTNRTSTGVLGTASNADQAVMDCACDGSQTIDYVNSAANGAATVWVGGFWDRLYQ